MGDEREWASDPMPQFTIKAKDGLALAAIRAYRELCVRVGLTEQAVEVGKALDEMRAWRDRNPFAVKMPDHAHVPAAPDG